MNITSHLANLTSHIAACSNDLVLTLAHQ